MQPTDPSKFTDKAWEAIVKSQDVTRRFKQQQLEVEHLALALLEQEGLAATVLNKVGFEPSRLKQQVESFAQRQPKVSETAQLYLGRSLDLMLDKAETARQVFQDEYISIEHMLLALCEDDRIGRRLFKAANVDAKQLETTIRSVRGSQKVSDQNPESRYDALEKFGRDLT